MKPILILLLILIGTTACDDKGGSEIVNTNGLSHNSNPIPTSPSSSILTESDVNKELDVIRVLLNTAEKGPNKEGMSPGERKRYDTLTKSIVPLPDRSERYEEQCLYRIKIYSGKLQVSYYKCPYDSLDQEDRIVEANVKDLDASMVSLDNNSISIPCVERSRNCVNIELRSKYRIIPDKSSEFNLKLWNHSLILAEQAYPEITGAYSEPLIERFSKVIKFAQTHPGYKTEENGKPTLQVQ